MLWPFRQFSDTFQAILGNLLGRFSGNFRQVYAISGNFRRFWGAQSQKKKNSFFFFINKKRLGIAHLNFCSFRTVPRIDCHILAGE